MATARGRSRARNEKLHTEENRKISRPWLTRDEWRQPGQPDSSPNTTSHFPSAGGSFRRGLSAALEAPRTRFLSPARPFTVQSRPPTSTFTSRCPASALVLQLVLEARACCWQGVGSAPSASPPAHQRRPPRLGRARRSNQLFSLRRSRTLQFREQAHILNSVANIHGYFLNNSLRFAP